MNRRLDKLARASVPFFRRIVFKNRFLLMKKLYISTLIIFLLSNIGYSQVGCPGCEVLLPTSLTADTVFITDAPSGQVGVYYDGDISFRMPMTTDPVHDLDPTIPEGFDISSITITSVANLPPGLSWEASQTEFDPVEETDGCVKFCGTPLQSGLFEVEVVVEAQVFIFTETASFSLPILIEPGVTSTEGFSIVNNSGCGTVSASFINNVPSEDVDGFSYFWDFGNGSTSIDENPPSQEYTEPGNYEVNYQAVVDTSAYYLTQVTITATDCSDFLGNRPDLKIILFGPDGSDFYTADIVDNAVLPVTYDVFFPIGPGNYAVQVVDDDGGIDGADDDCGTVNFTNLTSGPLSDGSLTLELEIFHPIDTIQSTDTIYVYAIPETPVITTDGPTTLCAGEQITLSTSYEERVQWFRDSLPIVDGDQAQLVVSESGSYWVEYTSEVGCTATSEQVEIIFSVLPEIPIFFSENNLLTLEDPNNLPEDVTLQWFLNGNAIEGANDLAFCAEMDGNYTLEVTDNETGCANSFSLEVIYDPDFVNCTSSTADIGIEKMLIYPNPVQHQLQVAFSTNEQMMVSVVLYDVHGKHLAQYKQRHYGTMSYSFSMVQYPAGLYLVQINTMHGSETFRVIKQGSEN